MSIPERLNYLAGYISKTFSSSLDRISAPLILKGDFGVGKSWVINEVYKKLREQKKSSGVIPLFLPIQLSGIYIIDDIINMMRSEKKRLYQSQRVSEFEEKDFKYLIMIENIDKVFNLDFGEKGFAFPTRAKGSGVSKMNYIQQSSRLRSFLIEQGSTVSLLATAVHLDFMNDPELPFYNFFNVVKIDPLGRKESVEYVEDKIGDDKETLKMFRLLARNSEGDHLEITDGVLAYLNLYVGTLFEISKWNRDMSFKELIDTFNSIYFTKLNSHMESILQKLSYSEKMMMDHIARVRIPFRVRDLHASNTTNNSRIITNLREKGILASRGDGRTATYEFFSHAMESWLKYHSLSKVTFKL